MSSCHNRRTPESMRQPAPCQIDATVNRRNGQPKWWCETHGQPAWGADGGALGRCIGSADEPPDDDAVLDLDLADVASIGVWGALPPAFSAGTVSLEPGSIHVHVRVQPTGPKLIDSSYLQVRLRNGSGHLVIDGEDARAFSMSQVAGMKVEDLSCRRCGRTHVDRDEFAVRAHRKHQCMRCSRDFWATEPSVSNPLVAAHEHLGLPPAPPPLRSSRRLALYSRTFSGVAVWASSPAIAWTGHRPQLSGLHVHAWDRNGVQSVDETFERVSIDGVSLSRVDIQHLQVARSLPSLRGRLETIRCPSCRSAGSEPRIWTAATTHECALCGRQFRTRRKSLANGLIAVEADLAATMARRVQRTSAEGVAVTFGEAM